MAMEARQRALSDEQQRLVILSREKFERDQISYISEAEARGEARGKAEGEALGEARGKAEGEAMARQKIAQNLLTAGMDLSTIAQMTGLSLDELAHLNPKI